jgi:hypothetical protein
VSAVLGSAGVSPAFTLWYSLCRKSPYSVSIADATTAHFSGTSCITTSAFLDTNVVVYAFGSDLEKVAVAERLLDGTPTISTQVVNEFISVCRIKLKLDQATS